jgi:serine/threonine protein kinase
MKFLHFFLLLWVIFALLNPDPEPTTQINADPCGSRSATLLETGRYLVPVLLLRYHPVEFIHSRHYCHNDIKAQNILLGPGQDHNAVYLIDFGLACKYKGETSSFTPVGFQAVFRIRNKYRLPVFSDLYCFPPFTVPVFSDLYCFINR